MLGRNLLGSFIVLQGNRAELETECLSACLIYLIYDGWLCITSLKNKQTNRTCHSFVLSFVSMKTSGQSRSLLFGLTAL